MQEESQTQAPVSPVVPVTNSAPEPIVSITDPAQQTPAVPSVETAPEVPADLVLGEPTTAPETATAEVMDAVAEEPSVAVQAVAPAEVAFNDPAPAVEAPTAVAPEQPPEQITPHDAPAKTVLSEQAEQPHNEPTHTADAPVKPSNVPVLAIVFATIVFVGLSAAALYLYFKK